MLVHGRCHCGHIAFEAEIDPQGVRLCNCTDCQTLSSAPFRWNVRTQAGTFKLLAGTPKEYVKTAESGNKRAQGFCPECGTGIYSAPTEPDRKVYVVRVGTLAERRQLAPTGQIWMRSAHPWVAGAAGLPGTEKQ